MPGGAAEWIELWCNGFPAGTIHFKSEFFPQAVVGGLGGPVIVEQPIVMQPQIVAPMMKQGLVKIHAVEAHLQRNDGSIFDRMSPFVIIRIDGREVFRNQPCF